jgi:hypothetical protein
VPPLIPEFFGPTLDKLDSMPEDEVVALRDALSRVTVTLEPTTLAARVRSEIKTSSPELDEVIQTLIALSAARMSTDRSLDDFSKYVARSVGRRKEKPKDYDYSAFEQRLVSLLNIESVVLSARAADIQHDYERVFASARIVSDIRSVFGTSNIEPVGAMIVHNLKITHFQAGRLREAFFALDHADLTNLRKVLDRAELKAVQLKEMINKTGVQYLESKGEHS